MQLFVDFDYTLFDTARFRDAMKQAIAFYGVTPEQFQRAEDTITSRALAFTVDRVCGALMLPPEKRAEAQRALQSVVQDTSRCLYPDARDFLQRHHDMEIVILSAGDPAWQKQKIFNSGIRELVSVVIPTDRPKETVIQERVGDQRFVFVNDRGTEIDAVKQLRPMGVAVWVQRPNTPYTADVEPCKLYDQLQQDLSFDLHTLFQS